MVRASGCVRFLIVAVLVAFGGFSPLSPFGPLAPAQAAGPIEKTIYMIGPRYSGYVPTCEYGLNTITWRFAQKEGRFWASDLRIISFEDVREDVSRPWIAGTIPRRFCNAVANVNDGLKHKVYYSIGEDTGMIGMTWGVEWCVDGLDRNWAYNPHCKMARP
jgi:hypothetical protein